MAKKKSKPKADQISFEESLVELQVIVQALEQGDLSLDDSLAQFENGVGLLRRCYQTLEAAEQKIELLTGIDKDGNPVTEPFDATATYAAPAKKKTRKAKKDVEADDGDTLF